MKMKVWRQRADENITMANNIVGALADQGSLLGSIMSYIFEGDYRNAIHSNQQATAFGYEVWCIEIKGRMGWFRPADNLPPLKIQQPKPPVAYNEVPVPVTYNTSPKSSLSFLTRLFTFR